MNQQKSDSRASTMAMNLEVHVICVSDVSRSKEFYQRLSWRFERGCGSDEHGPHRAIHPSRLGLLGYFRPGSHRVPSGLGGGGTDRLGHQSGP
jgi:hypothetical protein